MSDPGVNQFGRQRGYPLSALFALISVAGVLAALLAPVGEVVIAGNLSLLETLVAAASGCVAGCLLGVFVGLHHYRRMRGVRWGGLAGAAIGSSLGPLVLLPTSLFPRLMWIAFGGSALLVTVAWVIRAASRHEPPRPVAENEREGR